MAQRVLVIGGGAAGMSAASATRRMDPDSQVTVLEGGPYASYGVCGIPYYLAGAVGAADDLIARTPAEFAARGIDLRLGVGAESVDAADRLVRTSERELLPYDRLVVATGAAPLVPPVPGVDLPGVVTVRRLDDAIRLHARLTNVSRAIVVGAGYVGLETAEALHARGIEVTVLDQASQVMLTLDEPLAAMVENELRRHVGVVLGRRLHEISSDPGGLRVRCGEESWTADLVVLALGVRPSVSLAVEAGARTATGGALLVDDQMRTTVPGVLAAGDCVALHHRVTGEPAYVPLGPAANKTGRVAGTVAAGGEASFPGIVGTAVAKVFDLTVARTGLTLTEANHAGLPALATDVTSKSRAAYYPGAVPVQVRLVHTAAGRLVGAQIIGREGVAQRIDVIAAVLHHSGSVDDVAALDLAYAPPYAPVYDPLTRAAQAAQRRLAEGAA